LNSNFFRKRGFLYHVNKPLKVKEIKVIIARILTFIIKILFFSISSTLFSCAPVNVERYNRLKEKQITVGDFNTEGYYYRMGYQNSKDSIFVNFFIHKFEKNGQFNYKAFTFKIENRDSIIFEKFTHSDQSYLKLENQSIIKYEDLIYNKRPVHSFRNYDGIFRIYGENIKVVYLVDEFAIYSYNEIKGHYSQSSIIYDYIKSDSIEYKFRFKNN